jgi:RNA polymerase sigma-70 factor, ECF subfamily
VGARVIETSQPRETTESGETIFDFEVFFRERYAQAARIAARVTGDPARAEDLAAEALWKLWRTPAAHGPFAAGWLHRTAVRLGLNELRGRERRGKYENLSHTPSAVSTPEEVHSASEERAQVRSVLASMDERNAELLLLRASGMSYNQVAQALEINPASVGTLIARAQRTFRKEYVSRYGNRSHGR